MENTCKKKSLKFALLYVGGLVSQDLNKTCDSRFMNTLEKFDIIFLVETHIGHGQLPHKIGPFYFHAVCRPMSKHNNIHFGGLGILCKDNIKPHVNILKYTSDDFQWLQLDKNFFGLQENLFICVV